MKTEFEEYSVYVNYGRSLAEMISVGDYHHVDEDVVKKKPIHQVNATVEESVFKSEVDPYRKRIVTNETQLVVVKPSKGLFLKEVLGCMDRNSLRPARIEELLALCEKHLDLGRYPTLALGSVWSGWFRRRGFAGVAWINNPSRQRLLTVEYGYPFFQGFREDCQYLAANKIVD